MWWVVEGRRWGWGVEDGSDDERVQEGGV
jgi:hypothetical protein